MVVFPSDPKQLIAPNPIRLIPHSRPLQHANPYTGRRHIERTAHEYWIYECSWSHLKPHECELMEVLLARMKAGEAAQVPIYHAANQADLSIETTAASRAREATLDTGSPTPGMYFRVGDELKQISTVDGSTLGIFPIARAGWTNQTVQTGQPTGIFELLDLNASVEYRRGHGVADLTFIELIT